MLLTNNIFIVKVGSCRHVRSNVHKRDVFCPFCCTSWKLSSKRSHLSKIYETTWMEANVCWFVAFALFYPFNFPLLCTEASRLVSLYHHWLEEPFPQQFMNKYFTSEIWICCSISISFRNPRTSQFLSSLCSLLQLHTCFHFPHLPGLPTHLLSCTSFHHQPLSI